MARTLITPKTLANQNLVVAPNAADFVPAACDSTNFNDMAITGRELLVFYNSGGSAYTVTIYSAADSFGRSGAITAYSLGTLEYAVFGPFPVDVYAQTTGRINFDASNAAVLVAGFRLAV
jgi:hypothetical protein